MKKSTIIILISTILFYCTSKDDIAKKEYKCKTNIQKAKTFFEAAKYDSALICLANAQTLSVNENHSNSIKTLRKKIQDELSRELIFTNVKLSWEKRDDTYCLIVQGNLKNISKEHLFDQILYSYNGTVTFKNGKVFTYADHIDASKLNEIQQYDFEAYILALMKYGLVAPYADKPLKPNDQKFIKLGHEPFISTLLVLNQTTLFYPIERITFTLSAEGHTPMDHVWKGTLLSCDVPFDFK